MGARLYLLDTCILLHLIRGDRTGAAIEAAFRLKDQRMTPLICVVTHGEIRSLAREKRWGPEKRAALDRMLESLVTVDIHADEVIEAYVEVDDASRHAVGGAVRMGKNDLWIAAVARVAGATLLTTDRDFDHLGLDLVRRITIDPRTGPIPPPGEPS